MADTIKVPGIGPLEKKYAYIGIAGVAGFVGYAYWRNKQAAAADTTATDSTDTSALDSAVASSTDPYVYGSGDGGYAYGGGSPVYQSPVNGWPTTGSGTTPTSDSEWYQKASEWLENSGVDAQAAGHALSLFLADLCMTSAEADLVRQAKGAIGDPPQTHHNIQICQGTTPPPTGTPAVPANFHVSSTDKSGVTLSWTPVPGAQRYLIHIGGGPQKYNHTVTDTAPPYRFGSLSKNSTYSFNIRSEVGGVDSPASATIPGKTKSK